VKHVLLSSTSVFVLWALALVLFPVAAVAVGGLCASAGAFAVEEMFRHG
jgi:hypothetical protein